MTYTPDRDTDEGHAELPATDARQGRWGRHMLWVLLAGLVLVIIALFGSWASRAPDLEAIDAKSRSVVEEGPTSTPTKLVPARQSDEGAPPEGAPQP